MESYSFMTAKGFKGLVNGLLPLYKVYGTLKKDGLPAYGEVSRFEDLNLSRTPTHISAKGFLFPPRETLLRFNIKGQTFDAVSGAEGQAIIGLHPCDIHAINLMDRVFGAGVPDANYLNRRAGTVIIGTDCMPDAYCFCKSLGTMTVEGGFDIFLHAVKGGFLVRIGTEKGATLLKKYASLRKASPRQIREMEETQKKREASFKAKIDSPASDLPGIYSKSDESKVWDRLGSICYGCGSCNNVCPTCYCFDVRDEIASNLNEGERVRYWDACTLAGFASVAGGHSFRKTRAERLRHRFNRKFNYLTDRFGALFCVGCGRCSRTCLVRINISEVTNELIREYNAKK